MKWNRVRPMANINQQNIMHKSNFLVKLPTAYRIPIVSERGKWIDETLLKKQWMQKGMTTSD
jgi:hypothetical protein